VTEEKSQKAGACGGETRLKSSKRGKKYGTTWDSQICLGIVRLPKSSILTQEATINFNSVVEKGKEVLKTGST